MAIVITSPAPWQKLQVGALATVEGTASPDVAAVELLVTMSSKLVPFSTVPVENGAWHITGVVPKAGKMTLRAKGRTAGGAASGQAELTLQFVAPFSDLVDLPKSLNPGLTRATQAVMKAFAGGDPGKLTDDCSPVTNALLKAHLVTENVGPFKVTGLRPAVASVRKVMASIHQVAPQLHDQLGTAGMLCCRRVRPPKGEPPSNSFSNHSWGTAIDLKVAGILDPRGDGKAQRGLVEIAPIFNDAGWFWGAAFSGKKEDAMHFEASKELLATWKPLLS